MGLLTSGISLDGEVVWSWRPERSGAKLPTMRAASWAATVANGRVHRGERL